MGRTGHGGGASVAAAVVHVGDFGPLVARRVELLGTTHAPAPVVASDGVDVAVQHRRAHVAPLRMCTN